MRIALCAGLLLTAAVRADDPAVVAARARQGRVLTLQALIRHTAVLPLGAYSNSKTRAREYKGKAPVPAKELVLTGMNRLMLSGDVTLIEDTVRYWQPGGPATNRLVHIWDGTKGMTFAPDGTTSGEPPFAVLKDKDEWVGLPQDMPLLFAFRPMDAVVQPRVKMGRLTPTGGTRKVDGEPCVEYESTDGTTLSRRLFLSPRMEYLPVFIEEVHSGTPVGRTMVAYQQYARGAWFPVRWVTDWPSDDGTRVRTFEVVSLRVNEPLAPSVLIPIFRPGTTVHDYVKGRRDKYIVEPDGSLRLVSTPPPPLPLWRRVPATAWGAVVVLLLGAVAAAWLLDRLRPRAAPRE